MMRFIIASIVVAFISFFPGTGMAQEKNTDAHTKVKVEPAIEITASENRIIVKNAPANSRLEIYSVVGMKVKEINLKQSSGEYPVNIAKGYYIVRINDTVRKIIIR